MSCHSALPTIKSTYKQVLYLKLLFTKFISDLSVHAITLLLKWITIGGIKQNNIICKMQKKILQMQKKIKLIYKIN